MGTFGNHIMVEQYMGDMRFDRCILLAKNSPDALDWSSFPREWRRPDFLLLARLRQPCLWLEIRSGTQQRVCVPSSTGSTYLEQRQQQAAEEKGSGSKLLLQPRRLTRPMLAWPHVDA